LEHRGREGRRGMRQGDGAGPVGHCEDSGFYSDEMRKTLSKEMAKAGVGFEGHFGPCVVPDCREEQKQAGTQELPSPRARRWWPGEGRKDEAQTW
jgi:hypothetical protein